MNGHFPIVLEKEDNGAISAYVPGLPVYAAADTYNEAERAIRDLLAVYFEAHPDAATETRVRVAKVSGTVNRKVEIVGIAALVGAGTSRAKARSSRENGKLGGRPRGSVKDARHEAMGARRRVVVKKSGR